MKVRQSTFLGALMVVLIFSLSGCSTNGGTIDEPDITVDYLSDEYADQLVRDGADEILGSLTISHTPDGLSKITIASKVIVENTDYDNGYYVADKNDAITATLDPEARITCIPEEGEEPEVASVEDLKESLEADDEGDDLYNVYLIGDQALLVLAEEL